MLGFTWVEKKLLEVDTWDNPIASVLFHGEALRRGAKYELLHYSLGDDLTHPLWLTHEVEFSQIFQPSLGWIVGTDVRDILVDFNNLKLIKVHFAKIFSKEKSPRIAARLSDGRILSASVKNDPTLPRPGDYYELVLPSYRALSADHQVAPIGFEIELEIQAEPEPMSLWLDALEEFPLFEHRGATFLRQDAFDRISPFLNRSYFKARKYLFDPSIGRLREVGSV